MSLLGAITRFEQAQGHLQRQVELVRGKLGLPSGTVTTSRSNYHWVRLFGSNDLIVQAFNNKTPPTFNQEVYVAVDPYRHEGAAPYVVMGTVATIGTVMDALVDEKGQAQDLLGAHAAAHEYSEVNLGRDPLNVHARAIVPLRVQALPVGEMRVYVNPGYYMYQGVYHYFRGGYTATITPPGAGERLDLVYLDCANNAVEIEDGTAATSVTDTLAAPALPDDGCIPLAHVQINENSTVIDERHIFDMRPFLCDNHAAVTLAGGSDPALALTGQELELTLPSLGYTFTPGEYTSTSWDGDAKAYDSSGIIDLSAVFGLPAGIKAISCRLSIKDETINVVARLSSTSSVVRDGIVVRTQVANQYVDVAGIVACDANGDVYFLHGGELDGVEWYITGYFS